MGLFYLMKGVKPTSRSKPQPTRCTVTACALSSCMWFGALACEVLVLLDTLPFDGEADRDKGLQSCGGYRTTTYKCYAATSRVSRASARRCGSGFAGPQLRALVAPLSASGPTPEYKLAAPSCELSTSPFPP